MTRYLVARANILALQSDLGDDVFTRGRPHPMIDPSQRLARLVQEARDPSVGVIVLDFILYGAMPLAFAILDPARNALPAAVLLMSFFANGTTFLAYAIMAERRQLETSAQGVKSLYYVSGLAEGFETVVALAAFCIWPQHFPVIAYTYATLCFLSASGRILIAWRVLK